ncbi:MAG: ABC transporter ATP-binding protein [Lachnospiraceae bacterium]|nr:ABC transporter ATP-binding protein [Lachnospiraceae bacterium]
MEDIAIKVDHITKVYRLYNKPSDRLRESLSVTHKKYSKDHYALSDISFEVKRGETVGLIGTNGAGKSTILKIITGVTNPTEGKLEIDGRISALLELGAGFNMEYTGVENVYLNGTMNGFSEEEIDARLPEILEFADIGEFAYQPVKTYSSGMFVRLAFAVAINIDPEILIVDEALSVGDVFFQSKCYHKFEEFKKMGKTILFVSHDLSSVAKYCDRVVLLNKGTKLAEGNPREMVDLYKRLLVNQIEDSNAEGKKDIKVNSEVVSKEMTWMSRMKLNPDVQEYGENIARITDFAILDENGNITNIVEKGKKCSFKIKMDVFEEVEEPILAVTIKNLHGTDITGTNTSFEGESMGLLRPGDCRIATFTQEVNLQGGEYLISLGCTGFIKGEFHVFHRLYDICNLTVLSNRDTVGFFDMNASLQLENPNGESE